MKNPTGKISIESDGFELSFKKTLQKILWTDITEIYAFKEDVFTYDMVWFEFTLKGKANKVYISEETNGFEVLDSELVKRLPNYYMTWRNKVIVPAFEENRTLLFEKREAERS